MRELEMNLDNERTMALSMTDEMTTLTSTPAPAGRTSRWLGLGLLVPLLFSQACGGSDLSCGDGTEKKGGQCLVAALTTDGGGDAPDVAVPPSGPRFDFDGLAAAAPAAADAVVLYWLPAEHPADPNAPIKYAVYASTESGSQNFTEPLRVSSVGATSMRIEGLDAEEWFFVVRATVDDDSATDENTVEQSATPSEDTTPPTFGGVTKVEPGGSVAAKVSWEPADDDKTPAEGIVYQVFWSDTETRARFGALGAVSLPGATSVEVPRLPDPEGTYYFHVKAADAAGNVDENTTEMSGQPGEDKVPPVFGGCRAAADPTAVGATVTWDPASDDTTPTSEITYRIYAFEVPVTADTRFENPSEFPAGSTTVELEGLSQDTEYRIVCRAVDAYGNEDDNIAVSVFETLDDGTPPDFVGLDTVEVRSTEADLSWEPATDDQTDQAEITYLVYASNVAGEQEFDAEPIAESPAGATGMTVFGLEPNTDYFFVVRARDIANNKDPNTAEKKATTLVSFALNVQPILTETCALSGCHVPGNPPQGQVLAEGYAYSNIVDVPARGVPTMKRVDSTKSDPLESYMYRKIVGAPNIVGEKMPAAASGKFLTQDQIDIIGLWISQGAKEN